MTDQRPKTKLHDTLKEALAAWLILHGYSVQVVIHRDIFAEVAMDWKMVWADIFTLRQALAESGIPVAVDIGSAAVYFVTALEKFQEAGLLVEAPPAIVEWYTTNMVGLVQSGAIKVQPDGKPIVPEVEKTAPA